jgi:hypothetical protein
MTIDKPEAASNKSPKSFLNRMLGASRALISFFAGIAAGMIITVAVGMLLFGAGIYRGSSWGASAVRMIAILAAMALPVGVPTQVWRTWRQGRLSFLMGYGIGILFSLLVWSSRLNVR